jgi:hypothetical protein
VHQLLGPRPVRAEPAAGPVDRDRNRDPDPDTEPDPDLADHGRHRPAGGARGVPGAARHLAERFVVGYGPGKQLLLFLVGAGEDDVSVQLVGATSISPAGEVAVVEAMPDPFSESVPGSPAQPVMAPVTSRPLLVYVGPDGVHVYERTG